MTTTTDRLTAYAEAAAAHYRRAQRELVGTPSGGLLTGIDVDQAARRAVAVAAMRYAEGVYADAMAALRVEEC